MGSFRAKQILFRAIRAYEFELEHQDYDNAEELHQTVLNEFGMKESEYLEVMKKSYCW